MAFFHPSVFQIPLAPLVSSTPKHPHLSLLQNSNPKPPSHCTGIPSPLPTKCRGSLSVKCNDGGSSETAEDGGALKTILKFYTQFIRNVSNNVVFTVRPTLEDGTTVGVKWRLGGSKLFMPLGKGFSIQSYHGFGGKLLIRNVEMMMEPLLLLNPIRLKMVSAIASMMEQMNMKWGPKQKKTRAAAMALGVFFLFLSLFFLQFSVR